MTGATPLDNPRKFAELLDRLCKERGAVFDPLTGYGDVGRITLRNGAFTLFRRMAFDINRMGAAALARDKDYCARALRKAGLNAAEGTLVVSPRYRDRILRQSATYAQHWHPYDDALKASESYGFPLYIKPNDGSSGEDVALVRDRDALLGQLSELFSRHEQLLVQPPVAGREFRMLMLDDEMLACYERVPFTVTGNGEDTLADLILERMNRLRAGERPLDLARVQTDIDRSLSALGLQGDYRPAAGETIRLGDAANLATGGSSVDFTDTAAPFFVDIGRQAAAATGLRLAGIDIFAADIAVPDPGYTILEVNAAPGFGRFAAAQADGDETAERLLRRLLDAMENTAP